MTVEDRIEAELEKFLAAWPGNTRCLGPSPLECYRFDRAMARLKEVLDQMDERRMSDVWPI